MRLHRLWLRAFGPFADEQEIDFGRLSASGLFLLEGPTGAGKTTILDAITFALYGQVSGENGSGDRLHSDFAADGIEPRVELEFAVRGVRHRISRVPEYQRRKKRGEGVTTEAASVHLERRRADGTWASLSSSKAEAGALVTEVIGLTRDQFTQVALLPQGEFARFLRSGDDDRRELLTRLFGTQLYDRVTAELDRRRYEAERRRREAQVRITSAVAAALEAAGIDGADASALLRSPAADLAGRLEDVRSALAAGAAAGETGLELAGAALAEAGKANEVAAGRHELLARRAESGRALAAHEATRSAHSQREERLSAARRAEPIRPLLELLAEAEALTARRRAAVLELTASSPELTASSPELAASSPGLAAASPGLAVRDDGEAALTARAAAAERLITELGPAAESELELPALRSALDGARQRAAAAAEDDAALRKAAADLPAAIDGADRRLNAARSVAATLGELNARSAELATRQGAAERLTALRPVAERKRAEAAEAIDEHQRGVDEHQRLVQARLDGMAGELAGQLVDGQPCAVCGAIAHPAPAARPEGAVSAADVEAARQRRDLARARRETIEAALAALVREEAAQAALAAGGTPAELDAEAARLRESIKAGTLAAAEADRLRRELASLRQEASELGDAQVASAKRATSTAERAARAKADLSAAEAAVIAAAAGHSSVADRLRALAASAARDRELAAAVGTLARAIADEASASEHTAREVRGSGLASLEAARAAVLPVAELAALEEEVRRWNTQAAVLLRAAADAGLVVAPLDAPPLAAPPLGTPPLGTPPLGTPPLGTPPLGTPPLGTPPPAEATAEVDLAAAIAATAGEADLAADLAAAAAARLTEVVAAERAARRARDAAAARAARFALRLADVASAQQASADLDTQTAAEIRLAGLAKGVDGQRRVALTTYVLRHWFGQVVTAANSRLAAMSSGRYELRRTDDAPARRQRAGLTLTIIDRHTGQERSPGSLSGGETFYTSLALALGLADVVKAEAGGIDLETLFIDEGFGTLDAETLDQVMAVVDDLRNGGRVVGVVSHVTDLKDRIGERLEVRRTRNGASRVRLVA